MSLATTTNNEHLARFEVTGHYFLQERGGFVIGHILSGIFRIGMIVPVDNKGGKLTISGIEFLDNIREKTFANALTFRERPLLEYVQQVFPIGSVLGAYPEDTT